MIPDCASDLRLGALSLQTGFYLVFQYALQLSVEAQM